MTFLRLQVLVSLQTVQQFYKSKLSSNNDWIPATPKTLITTVTATEQQILKKN